MSDYTSQPDPAQHLLKSSVAAARRELETIEELFKREQLPKKLAEYLQTVNGPYLREVEEAYRELSAVEEAARDNNMPRAWRQYMVLRTERLPGLTNELLALIGGVYLQEQKLDALEHLKLDPALTASKLATDLLKELQMPIEKDQILIVGEERIGARSGNIMRLRFPACDIWNLPFIVHEYGYWYARSRLSSDFDYVTSRVRLAFDLRDPIQAGKLIREEQKRQFLDEVVRVWEEYGKCPEAERGRLLDSLARPIELLAASQLEQIYRLFADAFATYRLGPVYVLALLYLRFVPDETLERPTASMPSFEQRFVFALETLRFMNDNAANVVPGKNTPFVAVIKQLETTWEAMLVSLGRKNNYEAVKSRFTGDKEKDDRFPGWLPEIKTAARIYRESTKDLAYYAWSPELILTAEIGKVEDEANFRQLASKKSPRLEVLNAAWQRRLQTNDPNELKRIEQNALRLLADPEAFIFVEESPAKSEARRPPDTASSLPRSQPRSDRDLSGFDAASGRSEAAPSRSLAWNVPAQRSAYADTSFEVASEPSTALSSDERLAVSAIMKVLSQLTAWTPPRSRFEAQARRGTFTRDEALVELLTRMGASDADADEALNAYLWIVGR
jgi:hypothetical protein